MLSYILITFMYIQLLHALRVLSLRFTPQCHTFIQLHDKHRGLPAYVCKNGSLKWPRLFSITTAITPVELRTMKCRVLERKLCFLQWVMGSETGGLSIPVKEALSDDVSSLCLVRSLENQVHRQHFERSDGWLQSDIKKKDRQQLLARCEVKSSHIALEVGWSRVWDACFSLGEKHTTGLQKLSRVMSHHQCCTNDCINCRSQLYQPKYRCQLMATAKHISVTKILHFW